MWMTFGIYSAKLKKSITILWRFLIAIDSVDISDGASAMLEKIMVLQVK
jgi:hypothetical protein